MSECKQCRYKEECTPFEKQLFGNDECIKFEEIDFDSLSDESEEWKEFSYHKYTDNLLDYGEMSEWDKYILEEESLKT